MDLRNSETFQNVFLACFFVGIGAFFVLWKVYKKRGITVLSKKNKFILLIIGIFPILVLFWVLPDVPLLVKIGITFLILATEFGYFYLLGKAGKSVRKTLGIETEEDRYEKDKEQKEKTNHRGQTPH